MNRYDLAIVLLTDAVMETLPSGADYIVVREILRDKIAMTLRNIRDNFNRKEQDAKIPA